MSCRRIPLSKLIWCLKNYCYCKLSCRRILLSIFTWFVEKLVIVHCHAGEYWCLYAQDVSKNLLLYWLYCWYMMCWKNLLIFIVKQRNTVGYTHMMCQKTCYCTLSCRGILLLFLPWWEEGRRLHPSMDCIGSEQI